MLRLCAKCGMTSAGEKCPCGGDACACADCQFHIQELIHSPHMAEAARALCDARMKAAAATLAGLGAVPTLVIGMVCAGAEHGRPVVAPLGVGPIPAADVPRMLRQLARGLEAAARAEKAGDN